MTFHSRLLMISNPGLCQWVGVLVVAIWFVFTEQSAKASCGDYLYGHERSSSHANRETQQRSNEAPGGSPSDRMPHCSGPTCHAAPSAPFELPKTSIVRVTVKELCQCERLISVDSEDWGVISRNSSRPTESPAPSPLERPPRIV